MGFLQHRDVVRSAERGCRTARKAHETFQRELVEKLEAHLYPRLASGLTEVELRTSTRVAIGAALALLYFVTGKLGLEFAMIHPSASAIWAPAGISLAACLIFGYWVWPAIFVGAFLVNFTTLGVFGVSLMIATGNTLEALTGTWLVNRFAGGRKAFDRAGDALKLNIVGPCLSTMVAATIGVGSLYLSGHAPGSQFGWIWLTWWIGDLSGDAILTPMLVMWGTSNVRVYPRKIPEGVLLFAGLLGTLLLVFSGLRPPLLGRYPVSFPFIPVMLWVAFRFGRRATATTVFLTSMFAIAATLYGMGPFAQGNPNTALLFLEIFLAATGTVFLLIAITIAERRMVDEARWRLAAIVESTDDAIVSATLEGQITTWNAGAVRMYGLTPDEAIGRSISIVVPPERMGEQAEVLARINHGETVAPYETVCLRKDGTRIDVSLTVSPVRDPEGRVVGCSKIARDITQLRMVRREREALLRSERAAREAAENANRAKDEFLAMLGHELRNPLHAISLASRLLENAAFNEGARARGIISRQVDHLSRLLDDLLDLARVTSGRIVLLRRPLNLAELVSDCLGNLQHTHQLGQHSLETSLEPVWVDGDADRLSQVVMNLLGNAIKYTPADGRIALRVSADAGNAVIEVTDNGIGIPPDVLPRVFDLFTRGHLGLERSPGGLGIGLTLVKRLAELHGGEVTAHSEGHNRGSTFIVALPRIDRPNLAQPVSNGAISPQRATRRVLIIEDHDDARESLRAWLQRQGHETHEAIDGPGGVEKALALRPDVIIVDVGLPGLDGYEVAQRIRAEPCCAHSILIAVSGYGQGEYRSRAEQAGFQGYVVKPVDTEALTAMIATLSSASPAAASSPALSAEIDFKRDAKV